MALVRWEGRPRSLVEQMSREMDRVFEDVLSRTGGRWGETGGELGAWSPSVNIYEKRDDLIVEAELPGVKKEDIDVRIENNVLMLRGERKREQEVEEESYYRFERTYGSFSRSFALPQSVDTSKIDASFKDGILKLTIPKIEEAKPKQIEIK